MTPNELKAKLMMCIFNHDNAWCAANVNKFAKALYEATGEIYKGGKFVKAEQT